MGKAYNLKKMKKAYRIKILLLVLACMIFVTGMFSYCTPADENSMFPPDNIDNSDNTDDSDDTDYSGIPENPQALALSKEGGVYSSQFVLTVEKKRAANIIYYTRDSSEPTKSSQVFPDGGIIISDNSSSASYPLGQQVKGDKSSANYKMLHGTTIRLLETDKSGKTVAAKTISYAITTDDAFKAVPSVFLTVPTVTESETNVKFIGDYDNTNKSNVYNIIPPWSATPVNSKVRPSCWGNVEYYDTTGVSFSRQTKISVSGAGSAQNSLRTLNLNFNKDKEGRKNEKVTLDVFNGADKSDGSGKLTDLTRFKLYDGGSNYARASISSIFVDEVADKMNTTAAVAKYGTPCHAFINGEYWGVYYTKEHISDVFFADNYSVDKDNVIHISKGNSTVTGTPPDYMTVNGTQYRTYGFSVDDAVNEETAWKLLGEIHAPEFYNGNFANDAVYDKFCNLVDVTSLADTMLIQGYIGNWDFASNNVRIWRTEKTEAGNPYADGKWRFVLHDTDYCFEPSYNTDRRVSGSDKYGSYTELDKYVNMRGSLPHEDYYLFQAPMQNKKFRALLLERTEYICGQFKEKAGTVLNSIMDSNFEKAYAKLASRWNIANLSSLKSVMQSKANIAISQGTAANSDYYYKAVQNTINRCIDKYGA